MPTAGIRAQKATLIRHLQAIFPQHRAQALVWKSMTPLLQQLQAVGVNEIACLADFAPDPDAILGRFEIIAGLLQC